MEHLNLLALFIISQRPRFCKKKFGSIREINFVGTRVGAACGRPPHGGFVNRRAATGRPYARENGRNLIQRQGQSPCPTGCGASCVGQGLCPCLCGKPPAKIDFPNKNPPGWSNGRGGRCSQVKRVCFMPPLWCGPAGPFIVGYQFFCLAKQEE